jgi:hypothetical protein
MAIGVPQAQAHALPTSWCRCNTARRQLASSAKENIMGKYFLGWLLGVPAIVLVVLWFFFH